jgi:lipopolysaccharide assembly outer membrane protein LptD (OstA)
LNPFHKHILYPIGFLLFVFFHPLQGQVDTTFVSDSTFTDSLVVQPKKEKTKQELKGPIHYEAQTIENVMGEKRTVLTGRAKVTYQDMVLTAHQITVDWDRRLLLAEGVLDTVWIENEDGDSIQVEQLVETPEFAESGDVMTGETMIYNFETRKGRVVRGRTAYEDGFYYGRVLKMVQKKTLNVGDAEYTTCDRIENPHFHFWSKKMKIMINDKVVMRPIVMYIGHVPVAVLPFGYFPIQKGRHSGILIPRYGESTLEGRYLRGIGYYWAASNYWDLKGSVDYFEKSGFLFRGDLRYTVRYKLSGRISSSWTRKNFDISGVKQRRWDLVVSHSQKISPTTDLYVNGRFISSGSFYKDLSTSREHRLQREIRSTAKLTKKLGRSGKVEVHLNQTRNLNTDQVSELLPHIIFSNQWNNLIPEPKRTKKKSAADRWYHAIRIPYSFDIETKHSRQKSSFTSDDVIEKRRTAWDHSLSMYSSPKLFGWLTFSPKISYRETWYDRQKEYYLVESTNTIEEREKKGFFALRTFSSSLAMSTKLYGLFRSRLLKKIQFRHVMTPRLSFSYRPDFSEEKWGYYQAVTDTLGEIEMKDRFNDLLFRSTPKGESRSLSMNLNNLFQMKIGEGEKAKKFDLFTWNLSTSYNWKATQFKLGDLSSRLQGNPSRNLSLSLNTTYSFYKVNADGNRIDQLYVDDINWDDWKGWFKHRWTRLTYISGNVRLSLKGRAKTGVSETIESPEEMEQNLIEEEKLSNIPGDRFDMDEEITGLDIPWDLNLNINYTENRRNPLNITKTFWSNINLGFNLTKNWKISYRARLDLVEKDFVSQDFVFYRDLHCWEARFTWTPRGPYKRFHFRISIKSPMLRDIKVEKGTGRRGIYGY